MPRRPLRAVVAGLDLSLTGAGVAVIDTALWTFDPREALTARYGYSLKGSNDTADHAARVDRLVEVPNLIVDFLKSAEVTHVWVENYSFGKKYNAHQLGEMCGCVKREIRARMGLVATPVSNSTARKVFLGRGAGEGIKEEVKRQLLGLGWTETMDEGDAFVVANYGLGELGFPTLSMAR